MLIDLFLLCMFVCGCLYVVVKHIKQLDERRYVLVILLACALISLLKSSKTRAACFSLIDAVGRYERHTFGA